MSLLRVLSHVLVFIAALAIGISLTDWYGLAAGVFAASVFLFLHDIADTLYLIRVELSEGNETTITLNVKGSESGGTR